MNEKIECKREDFDMRDPNHEDFDSETQKLISTNHQYFKCLFDEVDRNRINRIVSKVIDYHGKVICVTFRYGHARNDMQLWQIERAKNLKDFLKKRGIDFKLSIINVYYPGSGRFIIDICKAGETPCKLKEKHFNSMTLLSWEKETKDLIRNQNKRLGWS